MLSVKAGEYKHELDPHLEHPSMIPSVCVLTRKLMRF